MIRIIASSIARALRGYPENRIRCLNYIVSRVSRAAIAIHECRGVINYVASDWERDIDHDGIDMRGLRRIRAHRGTKVESDTALDIKLDSSFVLARLAASSSATYPRRRARRGRE